MVASERRSVRYLAMRGMYVLLDSAFTYGAGRRQRFSPSARLFPNGFQERLGGFFNRLAMPMHAVDGSSRDYVEGLEAKIGGQLDPWLRDAPLMHGAEYFRFMTFASGALITCAASPAGHRSTADLTVLLGAVDRVLGAYHGLQAAICAAHTSARSILPTPAAPFGVLNIAHAVLRADRNGDEVDGLDVDALTVLGAFLVAVTCVRQCEVCFRWAAPGPRMCFRHSLSAEVGDTPQGRQRRYQHAKRVADLVGLPVHDRPRLIDSDRALMYLIGRVLWHTSIPCEDRQVAYLLRLALQCPRAMIGAADFGSVNRLNVTTVLRQHIDPLEYRLGNWRKKLPAADLWGQLEDYLSTRSLGRRIRTTERLARAARLAELGASRKEVAASLEVDPTAVSHWIRRHSDDPYANRLARALHARS